MSRRRRRALRLAILLALALAGGLTWRAPLATGHDVSGSPMGADLSARTYDWWRARGRRGTPPGSLRIEVVDVLPGGATQGGASYLGAGVVWVQRGLWDRAQGWPLDRWLSEDRAALAAVLLHERGHEAGPGHLAGTVMDPCACVVPAAFRRWAEGRD